MKILMLNYEYPPLGAGAGVISKYITDGLAALGHQMTVLTTWYEGEKETEEQENVKIIRLKCKRKNIFKSNIFEMLSFSKESKLFLTEYCRNNSFDLCFANFSLPGGDIAFFVKKNFNIPYVVISHGHDIPWFFPEQMLPYHLFTYRWIKRICTNAERLFVQSEPMKINADKFMGKYKYKNVVIPNGGDFNVFMPDHEKKSSRFRIIFSGRLVKQKDPFTFLKAIKPLYSVTDDFSVLIIGDGPLKKKMQYYVNRNNLHNKVSFSGWLPKEQLLEEHQTSSLKVAPSLEEGMSISVMESLACGQYVITTPVSENPALIQDQVNGELVEMRDYRSLALKILRFYNEKFVVGYKVPDEIREEKKNKYSWHSIVKRYEEVLLGL